MSAAYRIGAAQLHGDSVRIPSVWLAFAVSVLLHALLLWSGWLPDLRSLTLEDPTKGRSEGALAVRISPPPRTAAPAAQPSPPPSPAPAPSAKALATPPGKATREAPRLLAREAAPSRAVVPPPSAATPPPAAASPAVQGDLASLVEARRRAREQVASPPSAPALAQTARVETEQERDNRIAAERLGLNRTPSFDGGERRSGGGIFQVARLGYEDAEFFFYGWNKQIRRNSRQMIEVRRGDAPSMEVAVVRKMISIIREYTKEDFTWDSQRLGREVVLSARPGDNAQLEDFMMREFFYQAPPARR